MKKSVSRGLLILLVLAVAILPSVSAMAACNKPTKKDIILHAPDYNNDQHFATAKISGVSKHAGQGGYDNKLKVGCRVKYRRVADGAKFWYSETYATANDTSLVSKKQTVTPLIHELVGADGSWNVTCNHCDVNSRRMDGTIKYESV